MNTAFYVSSWMLAAYILPFHIPNLSSATEQVLNQEPAHGLQAHNESELPKDLLHRTP